MDTGGEDSGINKKWINKQLERISSGDNSEIILARTDTRNIKIDILSL